MTTNQTIGTRVISKSLRTTGIIEAVDSDTYAETMLVVRAADGSRAFLKPSEVTSVHGLSWSCGCEPCVEARRMLGRAFAEAVS